MLNPAVKEDSEPDLGRDPELFDRGKEERVEGAGCFVGETLVLDPASTCEDEGRPEYDEGREYGIAKA